jgi:hypothetical protein
VEPVAVYRESSPGLRREFALYPERVTVRGRVLGGSEFETHVPLGEVSPEFGTVRFRSRRCHAGIALFCGLAAFLGLFVGAFGLPWTSPRVLVTAALAAGALAWGLAYYPKFTAYRFLNTGGVGVLDVIAAGPEKGDARRFVERVAGAVRELRAGRGA